VTFIGSRMQSGMCVEVPVAVVLPVTKTVPLTLLAGLLNLRGVKLTNPGQ
jgi:hypothetical protein